MAFEHLSEREKQVLYNLITHYIQSADPVGSRVIANRFTMGLSSATIRNTLQDLEELGLVEQPHTSAGRIPTDLGYRVYVDFLLKPDQLSAKEKLVIRDAVLKEGRGVDAILGQTCKVLGDITRELGVSIAPRFDEGVLKRLQLVPISDERIMVIVVVKSGLARSVIIEIQAAISETSLRQVEAVLNERLCGLTLGDIRRTITDRLADVAEGGRLVKLLLDSKDRIWTDLDPDGIHVAGADHLLQQPEFADIAKISELMRVLENGSLISDFLKEAHDSGLVIVIGQENKYADVINCSLVATSYRVGKVTGAIGIIGPTRMPYSKLVSVVEYTAKTITQVLSGIDQEKDQ
ncbi:MAG: heat-inducible transcriptional repressor HrcA [candidate division Zixibacteria bacterium]|nr:heat-inducible transcriptional repressor HrcA [candidate division Zixibacteria bacterium]